MIHRDVTDEELKQYYPKLIEIFGNTVFTDYDFLIEDKKHLDNVFGKHDYCNRLLFNDKEELVGFIPVFKEQDPGDYRGFSRDVTGISKKEFEETFDAIYKPIYWIRRFDSIKANSPWLVLPEYLEESFKHFKTPQSFHDSHPDNKSDTCFQIVSGITDLSKGEDFLSSLNTKKRWYLKKRREEEKWEELTFNFKTGFYIPDEFWEINAQHWYDFWLEDLGEDIAEFDKNNIFYIRELFKFLVVKHPESVIVTEVLRKDKLLGYNLCLLFDWKHVSPQVCSVNFFKADYSDPYIPTHAVHYTNIQHFYHSKYKWYCLGSLGEDCHSYGVYKTHFRNGDFKCLSNYCVDGHWIPDSIAPPLYAHGRLIKNEEEFETKDFIDLDTGEYKTYKRIV